LAVSYIKKVGNICQKCGNYLCTRRIGSTARKSDRWHYFFNTNSHI